MSAPEAAPAHAPAEQPSHSEQAAPQPSQNSPEQSDGPERRVDRRRRGRVARMRGKLIGMAVSIVILVLLLRKVELGQAKAVLANADLHLVIWSCAVIIPLTLLTALRFLWLSPPGALPGIVEATRLTLVSSALNLFLPAKLGDLSKSFFLVKRAGISMGVAVSIVVMERIYDLFAVLTLFLLGWLLGYAQTAPVHSLVVALLFVIWSVAVLMLTSERGTTALCNTIRRLVGSGRMAKLADIADGWPELLRLTRGRRSWLALFSLGFWLVHLVQLWLFFVAVRANVPVLPALTLSALVLITGLLPLNFAGIGVRDAAFVVLFAAYCPPEIALAAAALCLSRVLLPPLAALPFVVRYGTLAAERRRDLLRYERSGSTRPGSPG